MHCLLVGSRGLAVAVVPPQCAQIASCHRPRFSHPCSQCNHRKVLLLTSLMETVLGAVLVLDTAADWLHDAVSGPDVDAE